MREIDRYRFPLELVSAVFDLVFAEGVEAIFRFAIALIKRNEDVLLKLEFEDLIEFLKNGLFEVYAVRTLRSFYLYQFELIERTHGRTAYEGRKGEERESSLQSSGVRSRSFTGSNHSLDARTYLPLVISIPLACTEVNG